MSGGGGGGAERGGGGCQSAAANTQQPQRLRPVSQPRPSPVQPGDRSQEGQHEQEGAGTVGGGVRAAERKNSVEEGEQREERALRKQGGTNTHLPAPTIISAPCLGLLQYNCIYLVRLKDHPESKTTLRSEAVTYGAKIHHKEPRLPQ